MRQIKPYIGSKYHTKGI